MPPLQYLAWQVPSGRPTPHSLLGMYAAGPVQAGYASFKVS